MRALWLSLLLLAPACRPPSTGPVYLSRGLSFTLRAPDAGPRFFSSQEVVIRRPGADPETLLTAVENDGRRLSIVASTPLGMTLFVVQTRDGITGVEARVPLPSRFDPRILTAMVQLANWPLEDLRRGLEPGAELTEEGMLRTLTLKGKVVLTLVRVGQAPPYRNLVMAAPAMGLTLEIRALEEGP